ncbi:MAG: tetraacyldisaccharide 4'-kinase, partial [Planctomycetes bacterium]|nr:tetraacyldisaccharide 4'-kinase [Planctomycetota bacterium]MBU1518986.1 tetraacyldisaccharide 4'-kinase [Planctomycetota bacterium]
IFWRKLVTSKNQPLGYRLLSWVLFAVSLFYRFAVALRNILYNKSILKTVKVPAAVISIGNITTGGTGKTPLVAWLCNYFATKNIKTAVLTRGYRVKNSAFADEPAMLAKAAPQAKVIVNPDRIAGAEKAISQHNAKLLIMDDGFQHRKLARDVNIVAIDATEPFGYEKLLPAGLLREPLGSLKRADAVVITRINQTPSASCQPPPHCFDLRSKTVGRPAATSCDVSRSGKSGAAGEAREGEKISEIKERISKINPDIVFAAAVHKPMGIKLIKDKRIPLNKLAGRKIYAFCGIGNPDAFFQTLSDMALNIVGTKVYNDHHKYTESDIAAIYEDAKYKQAQLVLTTHKDWMKTALLCIDKFEIPFAALMIELEFIDGQEKIISLVDKAIEKYVSR